MSQVKLQAVKELLAEEKFEEAKAILRTMTDNATAVAWLAKLNQVNPKIEYRPAKWEYCELFVNVIHFDIPEYRPGTAHTIKATIEQFFYNGKPNHSWKSISESYPYKQSTDPGYLAPGEILDKIANNLTLQTCLIAGQLGGEGWEIINVTQPALDTYGRTVPRFLLKRPVSS